MSGPWVDRLLDYVHDAGATVCWGERTVASSGNLGTRYFFNVQMPDRVVEQMGPSLNSAAWCCMMELDPVRDPLDQPEPK